MKAVLLDMDGVVLHQPNIHRFVSIRATSFVRDSLKEKIPKISFHHADIINKHLYTTYGHTLTGLNKVFQINKTIEDFNQYVYDDITMSYIPNFKDDSIMIRRGKDVQKLLEKCSKGKMPVYIFSNAPIRWCKLMTKMLELPIDNDKIIGSDHLFFTELQLMKPMPHLYYKMDNMLSQRFHESYEVIFIDDSLVNLMPTISMKNWKSVLLCPNSPRTDCDTFSIRQNISEIHDMI